MGIGLSGSVALETCSCPVQLPCLVGDGLLDHSVAGDTLADRALLTWQSVLKSKVGLWVHEDSGLPLTNKSSKS